MKDAYLLASGKTYFYPNVSVNLDEKRKRFRAEKMRVGVVAVAVKEFFGKLKSLES
ncbi:MAG: hypothetical protein HQ510_08920 [Candidatus Marinimicrobia bacterium]|nr:hypothetical protein [Candidatus Neomarinimicrobiota bacterium]